MANSPGIRNSRQSPPPGTCMALPRTYPKTTTMTTGTPSEAANRPGEWR
ncbi:hypothetical protein ACGF12_29960 [Kitasatospora sp. NPDC048296]